jgi:uncharacterized protein YacL
VLDRLIVRAVLLLALTLACSYLRPFGLDTGMAALAGLGMGVAILIFEMRLSRTSLNRLIGAAIGSVLGIFGAYLICLVLSIAVSPNTTRSFLQILILLLMAYVGLVTGAAKGDLLNLSVLGGIFGGEKQGTQTHKILDTSVIIDGRISDICTSGFMDGILVIPQFVLRELQQVADSADPLKRNRGRRGLDILQKIQKMTSLNVQIVDDDFPQVREVDLKLIELAKAYHGKIVTNDFNLN